MKIRKRSDDYIICSLCKNFRGCIKYWENKDLEIKACKYYQKIKKIDAL